MDWFRWHHGTATDPKWRVVAKRAGQPLAYVLAVWNVVLERASMNDPRGFITGWDHEVVAAGLDMEPEQVEAIHSAMQGKTLDGDKVTGWEKRQPKRERETPDNSTERVQKHREAQKSATPANETPCNATERQKQPRGEEIRGEENREIDADAGAPKRDPIRETLESIGAWDDPNCRMHGARVTDWIRQGADLDLDILNILPAVLSRARESKGQRWLPSSLNYFDSAVAEAKTRRTKPLPEVRDNGKAQQTGSIGRDERIRRALAGVAPRSYEADPGGDAGSLLPAVSGGG